MPLGQSPLSGLPISGNPNPSLEETAGPSPAIAPELPPQQASWLGEDFAPSSVVDEPSPTLGLQPLEVPTSPATWLGEEFAPAAVVDELPGLAAASLELTIIPAAPQPEEFAGVLPAVEEFAAWIWTPRTPRVPSLFNVAEEIPIRPVPPPPPPPPAPSPSSGGGGGGGWYCPDVPLRWVEPRVKDACALEPCLEEPCDVEPEPPPLQEADYAIMPLGAGVVLVRALEDGTVRSADSPRAGRLVLLQADSGRRYYYAIGRGRAVAPEGQRVLAGALIAVTRAPDAALPPVPPPPAPLYPLLPEGSPATSPTVVPLPALLPSLERPTSTAIALPPAPPAASFLEYMAPRVLAIGAVMTLLVALLEPSSKPAPSPRRRRRRRRARD